MNLEQFVQTLVGEIGGRTQQLRVQNSDKSHLGYEEIEALTREATPRVQFPSTWNHTSVKIDSGYEDEPHIRLNARIREEEFQANLVPVREEYQGG